MSEPGEALNPTPPSVAETQTPDAQTPAVENPPKVTRRDFWKILGLGALAGIFTAKVTNPNPVSAEGAPQAENIGASASIEPQLETEESPVSSTPTPVPLK